MKHLTFVFIFIFLFLINTASAATAFEIVDFSDTYNIQMDNDYVTLQGLGDTTVIKISY